jgi:hypothetical protein
VAAHPGFDRFHVTFERDADGVAAFVNGPDRFVREGREEPPAEWQPRLWVSYVGTFRCYNPWAPGFRVYVRGDHLFLAQPDGEYELNPLGDGEFRVGKPWSADRVRFETILEGRPQRALYNGCPYWRSFVE